MTRSTVVVPGGGWTINAWTHEGLDVARWLGVLGYMAFVLKYRVQASDPDQSAFEGLHADWSAADRPSELHVFAQGGHGFGMVRQGLPSDRWTDLFLDWLRDLVTEGPILRG
jgi:hypothetical protein